MGGPLCCIRPGRFGQQAGRRRVLGQPAGTEVPGRAAVGDDVVGHRFSVLSFCAQAGANGSVARRGRPPAFVRLDRGFWRRYHRRRVTAMDSGQPLLERDDVLARIDERLHEASAGRGSLLGLEGTAGIGKTRLVLAAGRHGRDLGLTTLSARGSELEQDFAYGLVRQLFEAPLIAASPPERAELLAGAAGHAAALFGLAAVQEGVAGALLHPSFPILHALSRLGPNLGRRSQLLLCIDDVHWADQASLRFLHYLGRRLDELPVAVVAAARPGRPADRSPVLAPLAARPPAEVLELAPLTERAVAELIRPAVGTDA